MPFFTAQLKKFIIKNFICCKHKRNKWRCLKLFSLNTVSIDFLKGGSLSLCSENLSYFQLCQFEWKYLIKSVLLMYCCGRSGPLKSSGFLTFFTKISRFVTLQCWQVWLTVFKILFVIIITKGVLFHNLWKMILYCHIYLN